MSLPSSSSASKKRKNVSNFEFAVTSSSDHTLADNEFEVTQKESKLEAQRRKKINRDFEKLHKTTCPLDSLTVFNFMCTFLTLHSDGNLYFRKANFLFKGNTYKSNLPIQLVNNIFESSFTERIYQYESVRVCISRYGDVEITTTKDIVIHTYYPFKRTDTFNNYIRDVALDKEIATVFLVRLPNFKNSVFYERNADLQLIVSLANLCYGHSFGFSQPEIMEIVSKLKWYDFEIMEDRLVVNDKSIRYDFHTTMSKFSSKKDGHMLVNYNEERNKCDSPQNDLLLLIIVPENKNKLFYNSVKDLVKTFEPLIYSQNLFFNEFFNILNSTILEQNSDKAFINCDNRWFISNLQKTEELKKNKFAYAILKPSTFFADDSTSKFNFCLYADLIKRYQATSNVSIEEIIKVDNLPESIINELYPGSKNRPWGKEWFSYLTSGACIFITLYFGDYYANDESGMKELIEINRSIAAAYRRLTNIIFTRNAIHTAENIQEHLLMGEIMEKIRKM